LKAAGHESLRRGDDRPLELGQARLHLGPSQVGPDHTAAVATGVRDGLDLLLERALGRLVRHVDTATGYVEFPAVVDASEPVLFVAAEEQRRAPMRAVLSDQSGSTFRISKGDEPLAKRSRAE